MIEMLSINGSDDLKNVFIELGFNRIGNKNAYKENDFLQGSHTELFYYVKGFKLGAWVDPDKSRVTKSVAEFRAFLIQYFKLEGFSLLPSYFTIRWSKDPRWLDFISYVNGRTIGGGFLDGRSKNCYYGIDKEGSFCVPRLSELKNKPLELTLDQFFEFTKEEPKEETPEKWCIRGCKELEEWQLNDMGDKCEVSFTYYSRFYYTDDTDLIIWDYRHVIPNGYTEITFEEFKRKIPKKEKMKEKLVKKSDLAKIHEVACPDWKTKIVSLALRNPFADYVELIKTEIDEMFNAATPAQLPVLEEIFGKQDKSVDLKNFKLTSNILDVRDSGEFYQKAFYLSNKFKWELKKDSCGVLVLIPTLE